MSLLNRTLAAALAVTLAAPASWVPAVHAQGTLLLPGPEFTPSVCVEQLASDLAAIAPYEPLQPALNPKTSPTPNRERLDSIHATLAAVLSSPTVEASQTPDTSVNAVSMPVEARHAPPFATRKALREAALNPPAVRLIDIDYVAESLVTVAAFDRDAPADALRPMRLAQAEEEALIEPESDNGVVEAEAFTPDVVEEEPLPVLTDDAPEAEMTALPRPAVFQPAVPEDADAMIERATVQRTITPLHMLDEVLAQPITANFRDTELADVLAILARRAGVNVVGGTAITGRVTIYLKDVPLRQAMELSLQQNNLGIIQEGNVFRIVPLQEAQAANRISHTVYLQNADPEDIARTLDAVVMTTMDASLTSISPNKATRILIISGPPARVNELVMLANELDVAEPALPTITEAIALNYAEPEQIRAIIESMLTPEVGNVETDVRSRSIIVTDVPVVIEQVRAMLVNIDRPVKQVSIHAMLVDVVLRDSSTIGTQWVLDLLRRRSRSGELVGNLENLSFSTNLGNVGADALNAGILNIGVLSSRVNVQAAIAAETASGNSEILANPMVVTVENKPATISIVQEFPYQELTQTTQGPPVASTSFKDIGITLDVTPRVTNDDHVIVDLIAKQSSVSGLTQDGIPIEDKRQAQTTLRVANDETIFIGGLRNVSDRLDVSKVPMLGDIPIINFMFRNTDAQKINTELMIFLTCSILGESLPPLTADQEVKYEAIHTHPRVPNAEQVMFRNLTHPSEMRDPVWKWRRAE